MGGLSVRKVYSKSFFHSILAQPVATGAKEFAELYAKFLHSLGVIPKDQYFYCSESQDALDDEFSTASKAGGGVIVVLEAEDAERGLVLPAPSDDIPSPSAIPVIFSGKPGLRSILTDSSPIGDLYGNHHLPVLEIEPQAAVPKTAPLSLSESALLDRFLLLGAARIHFEGGTESVNQLQRTIAGTGTGGSMTEADIERTFLHVLKQYELRMRTLAVQPTDGLHFKQEDFPSAVQPGPTPETQWCSTKDPADIVNPHMKEILAQPSLSTESRTKLLEIFGTILSRWECGIQVPASAYNIALICNPSLKSPRQGLHLLFCVPNLAQNRQLLGLLPNAMQSCSIHWESFPNPNTIIPQAARVNPVSIQNSRQP